MNVILKILKRNELNWILRAKIVWNLKISAFQVSGSTYFNSQNTKSTFTFGDKI